LSWFFKEERSLVSEQDVTTQSTTLQRPTTDNPKAWKAYWLTQGWYWRTEPEIDAERQKYLTERRDIMPDIEQGIYPFKNVKLSRADVEWLLVTHEHGQGPVDWSDERQRGREGLDLRGANLCMIDLRQLPLARIRGGLDSDEWSDTTEKQRDMAAAHMEGANFFTAHLEGAHLRFAHLEGAYLRFAHLKNTHLRGAYLEKSDLCEAYLQDIRLEMAHLSNNEHIGPRVVDAKWQGANLGVIKWSEIKMLGDEYEATKEKPNGKTKNNGRIIANYEVAVRANRQLSVALQSQGLNEQASYFAYRAQKLQRIVLRKQRKFASYLFAGFLDLLAGYGYRPGRSVLWYLVIILGFALAYATFGHLPFIPDAFVFSLTSFHGRGFFPGLGSENSLHNPLVVTAAFEAVVGLLIEISFIATFTQRFFGK
jgi:uncharacterized protein YjbI with pentapeptide repeats